MNAAFNITHSSKAVINRELEHACQVSDTIMSGKRPWSDLFEKHSFFTKDYKYYLGVVSCSLTKEAHKIWSGYVESKVRTFVQNLDKHNTVVVAQVFMKKFERVHWCSTDEEMQQVQQGSLNYKTGNDADEKDTNEGGSEPCTPPTKVYTSTHYIGLELRHGESSSSDPRKSPVVEVESTPATVRLDDQRTLSTDRLGSKSINLTYEVNQFKTFVKEWEKYDGQLNCLNVQHLRWYIRFPPTLAWTSQRVSLKAADSFS